jgi:hypothetical protein
MSRLYGDWEITPFCGDFLVELRGIEPMAIAAWRLRIDGFSYYDP